LNVSDRGIRDQHRPSIDEVAAGWVARADRGLSQAERIALDAWRAADLRHNGSYVRACALRQLAAFPELPDAQRVAQNDDDLPPSRASWWRRPGAVCAMAASIAAAIGLANFLQVPGDAEASSDRHVTRRGEIRELALNEGSTAVLDTNTAVAISMQPKVRSVRVLRGDAWFQVAHDTTRPFEVHTNGLIARAVGTAFQVTRLDDGAEVIVSEGIVALFHEGETKPIMQLGAGNRFRFSHGRAMREPLEAKQMEQRLAWRDGAIILDGQTLASAAAEFNRYNTQQLTISNPRLGLQRVYGNFRVRDPEALAKAAAIAFEAKVTHDGNHIRLHD